MADCFGFPNHQLFRLAVLILADVLKWSNPFGHLFDLSWSRALILQGLQSIFGLFIDIP